MLSFKKYIPKMLNFYLWIVFLFLCCDNKILCFHQLVSFFFLTWLTKFHFCYKFRPDGMFKLSNTDSLDIKLSENLFEIILKCFMF